MNAHAVAMLSCCATLKTIVRTTAFVSIIALLTIPFLVVSSASSDNTLDTPSPAVVHSAKSAGLPIRELSISLRNQLLGLPGNVRSMVPLPQSGTEAVAIYQSDCSTPSTDFSLGSTICVKITDAPVSTNPLRRIAIVNPANFIQAQADVTSATQTLSFTLPQDQTATFGELTVDNRGTWRALSIAMEDYSTRAAAPFLVRDPQNQAADLSIQSGDVGEAGGVVSFGLFVTNNGPDAATNVQITDTVPAGTTFLSFSQEAGPTINCQTPAAGAGGTSTCVVPTLAKGEELKIKFIYTVIANPGTELLHSSLVASDTSETHTPDNATESAAIVSTSGGGATCVLDCPNNIVVTANTTENNVSGAIVTFGNAEPFGDCGTVTATPASGSFFPVGVNTVVVSSGTGGGSCSFQVTVLEEAAPTISCPSNVTTNTTDCNPAQVDPGTPTFSPAGVTVVGTRSDNLALTDDYPVGTTTIVWTATDGAGRIASCNQTITVNTTDNEAPTITAPDNVTVSTPADAVGQCGIVVGESVLGTPMYSDNCTVNVVRTGVPAGNFFPVGVTTITYTATDAGGNTATDTQTVTVTDGPPVIFAPPDASYVCRSEVPAADASQAYGPDVIDVNGNPQPGPPADSCGPVNVGVSETQSGAGSVSSPLIITRTFTATDNSGQTASAVQTITVIDPTPPTITAPADAAYECPTSVPAADPSQATASDNCATPTVTVTETDNGGIGSAANPKVITRTFTATDESGNTATDSQTITLIDSTAPVISCPANIVVTLPPNTSATSMAVNFATPTATDNCSAPSVTTTVASGSIFPVGTTTVTATATDAVGNSSSCSFTVTVLYDFTGFLSPVSNLPTLNIVNAGKGVPVKFSLSGDKGLNIFAAGSPYSTSISCSTSDPGVDITETVNAGQSSLSFDEDQYTYVWKTSGSWAGTCRQLVVKLNDGSEHRANFKFR